jgi:hypothetical protein
MALPCGSRTPFFKVIWMRAFMERLGDRGVGECGSKGEE